MKRFLLAATLLGSTQIVAMSATRAQSGDQPQAAASIAPAPSPARHHRRHRKHVAAAQPVAVTSQAQAAAPTQEATAEPAKTAPKPPHELTPMPAIATISAQEAAIAAAPGAGPGLTPMGAIRAGNADGTIPAWTGGLVGQISSKPLHTRPDPFPTERPLFSITAANVDQYAGKLALGTAAMIRTLPGYHVDVYPTHRTAAAPQFIYENAVANVTRAHLVHSGQGVEGAQLSIPFPVPHDGYEAIWNHILRWRGPEAVRNVVNIISTPQGDYSLQRWHEQIMLPYNTPGLDNPRKLDSLFLQQILSPPRLAGALTLAINHENPYDQAREAWSYSPGERRVRRAPDIDYDTPLQDTDGLETVDDYDMYNGALDRYDFTLVGRKEIYVPYNMNRVQDPSVRYAELINQQSLKPEYLRFELHRVWVVEAKLKSEYRHIYTRRTMYLDEDSWQCVVADRYDGRGNLWRTALAFPIEMPEVPVMVADGYEYIDLYQHRFLVQGLHNQEPVAPIYNATSLTEKDFTAESVRRLGLR